MGYVHTYTEIHVVGQLHYRVYHIHCVLVYQGYIITVSTEFAQVDSTNLISLFLPPALIIDLHVVMFITLLYIISDFDK